MADTTFVPGTVLASAWANDVNNAVYRGQFPKITNTWVNSVSNGQYEYLESASYFSPRANPDQIAAFAPVRSSSGSGSPGTANIGWSAFAYNDNTVGSTPACWGFYATTLRKAGANGYLHGMEIDSANLGTTVPVIPSAMFPSGLSDCLWLGAGGETAEAGFTVGTSSLCIGIISNDPAHNANFEKGIVFHNLALAGTDGDTGAGTALAFATGHFQNWYNNSGNLVAGFGANAGLTNAQGMKALFTSFGFAVTKLTDNGIQFLVPQVSNAVNYVAVYAGATGSGAKLKAQGSDTNINLSLEPSGTGVVEFNYAATPASVPANFNANRRLKVIIGGVEMYIAASTGTW